MTLYRWMAAAVLVAMSAAAAYAQTDQGKVSGTSAIKPARSSPRRR